VGSGFAHAVGREVAVAWVAARRLGLITLAPFLHYSAGRPTTGGYERLQDPVTPCAPVLAVRVTVMVHDDRHRHHSQHKLAFPVVAAN
jgi:hypothetical protein